MPLEDYLVGLAFFLPTIGATAAAAAVVTWRAYSYLRGAELVLVAALWFTLAVLAAHLVPLAFGILTRGTAVAAAAATLVLVIFAVPGRSGSEGVSLDEESTRTAIRDHPWSRWLACAGMAIAAVYVFARVRTDAPVPFVHIDVLNFHLPGVVRWIESGSLWQIDQLFPFHVTGNYPNSGDVLSLATVLPWHHEALARPLMVPFACLGGLATYALAVRCGAARTTAALASALVVVLPATLTYAMAGLPDAVLLFGFGTGVLFLIRHWQTERMSDLLIAGLGLGLAFGTKWYGLTVVAAVMITWVVAAMLARRGLRRTARELGILLGLILLVGGIWLVRNLAESGNPLFPQEISALGVTLFEGTGGTAVERYGFTVFSYLDDPDVLDEFVIPGIRAQLGSAALLLPVAAFAAFWFAVRRARAGVTDGFASPAVVALFSMAALVTLFWSITPGSGPGLQDRPDVFITVRWLVPAALLAAAVVATLSVIGPRAALAMNALLAVAIADAIRHGPDVSASIGIQAVVVVAALAAIIAALARVRRAWGWQGLRHSRIPPAAAAVAVLIALVAIGRFQQMRFSDERYEGADPTFAAIENAPEGQKVGLAGETSQAGLSPSAVLPAFGPRLENDVEYVGPWVDGLLREYEDEEAFVARVDQEAYDLLLIGRGVNRDQRAREERWARAAGFELVTFSDRLALYAKPRDA